MKLRMWWLMGRLWLHRGFCGECSRVGEYADFCRTYWRLRDRAGRRLRSK